MSGLTGTETVIQHFQEVGIGGGGPGDLCLPVTHFTHYCPVNRLGVWRGCHDDNLVVLGSKGPRMGWQEGCQRVGEDPRNFFFFFGCTT